MPFRLNNKLLSSHFLVFAKANNKSCVAFDTKTT